MPGRVTLPFPERNVGRAYVRIKEDFMSYFTLASDRVDGEREQEREQVGSRRHLDPPVKK